MVSHSYPYSTYPNDMVNYSVTIAGEQTCWCVSEDGGLIPESIDPSRELTQEQCLIHRGTLLQGDNDIEGIGR